MLIEFYLSYHKYKLSKIFIMNTIPDTLWLTPSPELKSFNHSLLSRLSKEISEESIGQWEYYQHQDEPNSLDTAVTLLHDYLKTNHRQVNLIGHSTGGLLGLMYASKHPERVKSLTLLAVGINPGIDWQSHYYVQRKLLPCDRQLILSHLANSLFGYQDECTRKKLVKILEKDLNNSASPHSLFKQATIPPIKVSIPLLICGSDDDMVVDPRQIQAWKSFLKSHNSNFHVWICPQGKHFFHHFYPELVTQQIIAFWNSL